MFIILKYIKYDAVQTSHVSLFLSRERLKGVMELIGEENDSKMGKNGSKYTVLELSRMSELSRSEFEPWEVANGSKELVEPSDAELGFEP